MANTPHGSVNSSVPASTRAAPSQCSATNGFEKYQMEKSRLANLRRVTTSVTTSEVHCSVRRNTILIHRYLRQLSRTITDTNKYHSPGWGGGGAFWLHLPVFACKAKTAARSVAKLRVAYDTCI